MSFQLVFRLFLDVYSQTTLFSSQATSFWLERWKLQRTYWQSQMHDKSRYWISNLCHLWVVFKATRHDKSIETFSNISVTTFYLPLIFILVLYWRIYQAARKRINKRKTDTTSMKKQRKSEAPKNFSAAKFRFNKRNKIPKEDWDSSQNSEAVTTILLNLYLTWFKCIFFFYRKHQCAQAPSQRAMEIPVITWTTIRLRSTMTRTRHLRLTSLISLALKNPKRTVKREIVKLNLHNEPNQLTLTNLQRSTFMNRWNISSFDCSLYADLRWILITDCTQKGAYCNGKGSKSSTSPHHNHFRLSFLLDAVFLISSFLNYFPIPMGHSKLRIFVARLFQQLPQSNSLQYF